jgi:hypothetical protein
VPKPPHKRDIWAAKQDGADDGSRVFEQLHDDQVQASNHIPPTYLNEEDECVRDIKS